MTLHDAPTNIPDTEVVSKAKGCKFFAEHKRSILEEAGDWIESGQVPGVPRGNLFWAR